MIGISLALIAIVLVIMLWHFVLDCIEEANSTIEGARRMSEKGAAAKGADSRPLSRAPGASSEPPLSPPGAPSYE